MPYREIISAAYDAGVEEEYNRLIDSPSGEAEYQLFIDLFNEYMPIGATVIDIGSGSGRYAEYLINRDCKVGVVDLSAKSLKAFSDRLSDLKCKDKIIFNRVSCATQLEWIESNLADAILLMGPLYHLINEEHRYTALNHCRRILKKGGLLFSVFLSPEYDMNKDNVTSSVNFACDSKILPRNEDAGIVTFTRFKGYEVPQFRCSPENAKNLLEAYGFKTICIRNMNFMDKDSFAELVNGASFNSCFSEIAPQFLYVGYISKTSSI